MKNLELENQLTGEVRMAKLGWEWYPIIAPVVVLIGMFFSNFWLVTIIDIVAIVAPLAIAISKK